MHIARHLQLRRINSRCWAITLDHPVTDAHLEVHALLHGHAVRLGTDQHDGHLLAEPPDVLQIRWLETMRRNEEKADVIEVVVPGLAQLVALWLDAVQQLPLHVILQVLLAPDVVDNHVHVRCVINVAMTWTAIGGLSRACIVRPRQMATVSAHGLPFRPLSALREVLTSEPSPHDMLRADDTSTES